jgi:hypothetical protein
MKMKQVYQIISARYPNTPMSIEFTMSTFTRPCSIYIADVGRFDGKTWDEAMFEFDHKDDVQTSPDEEEPEENIPEYNAHAMGCGLEDRGITDRYEAMRYGWEKAIERMT